MPFFDLYAFHQLHDARSTVTKFDMISQATYNLWTYAYNNKSVLRRVRNSCMLVLHLCFVIVVSQQVVDTRQMLYKYIIYENRVATSLGIIL